MQLYIFKNVGIIMSFISNICQHFDFPLTLAEREICERKLSPWDLCYVQCTCRICVCTI